MDSHRKKLTLIHHSSEVSQEEKKAFSQNASLRNQPTESEIPAHQKTLNKDQIINKLNFINFQEGTISLRFKHTRYDRYVTLDVKPLPCSDDMLDCEWIDTDRIPEKLKPYEFDAIYIGDGQRLILVKPKITGIHDKGACFKLPDTSLVIANRKVRRYPCKGINVHVIQHSSIFIGTLTSFNSFSFHVELTSQPPPDFQVDKYGISS